VGASPIPGRRRLGLWAELTLALPPTLTVLAVLGLVEALGRQRLLFAYLASSALLIYLDPRNATNAVRALVIAQLSAAGLGWVTFWAFGPGYAAAGAAMAAAVVVMVALDAVHPPAMSTALSFAFRSGDDSNLVVFGLAVLVVVLLLVLQRSNLWLLARLSGLDGPPA
jgi:CBS-domain-containing membrane protein